MSSRIVISPLASPVTPLPSKRCFASPLHFSRWCIAAIIPLLISGASALHASLVPSSIPFDWTPGSTVGVANGIPTNRTTLIDVTKSPYNADKTGTSDCTSAIAAAIDAANGTGKVVYLPTGTYLVTGRIYKMANNYTIRGDGDSTVIKASGGNIPFMLGPSASWDSSTAALKANSVVAGNLDAGNKVLAVSSTAGYAKGQLVRIDQLDDHSTPVVAVANSTTSRSRGQTAIVTAVDSNANTITISRPLIWSLNAALSPAVNPISYGLYSTGIGIEDLKIDASASTAPFTIMYENCTQSWIKNVHITGSYGYSIYLLTCCNCEIRHCNLEQLNHSGSNGALLIVEQTADSLVEDNIFYKANVHVEVNYGCTGNVFGYNYMYDSTIATTVGISIDSNHGPHNGYNLYEGNISPKFECDGYFGGASNDYVFRNWFLGTSPNASNQHPMILKRFTRNYYVVANALGVVGQTYGSIYNLGYPNIGNDSYTGTASLLKGSPWADWSSLLNGSYTSGPSGFQELDLDVQATTTLLANWDSVTGGVPAAQQLASGDSPRPSLYYSSGAAPSWFGGLAWPVFNPNNPTLTASVIPAGYRFTHNGQDPSTAGPTSTQSPMNPRISRSQ